MTIFSASGARLRKLRGCMKSAGLDCALLTSANDIYYYTGYRISDGDALLKVCTGSGPVLFVPRLENEASEIRTAKVRFIKKISEMVLPKRTGFDEYSINVATFKKLRRMTKLEPAAGIIKKPRTVKESYELEQIKMAISITARTLDSVLAEVGLVDKTEEEIAREIDIRFRQQSAKNAFDTIVASGRNSAFVHHLPGRKRTGRKELIIIDLGAEFNSYCSDVSRTFCKSPGRRERELHEGIRAVQAEIIDNIEPGVEVNALEKLYESLMRKRGYRVLHGFGHGVGLNVHEKISGKLERGMIITVEPGVYIKEFGGCRIEDMVLVGKRAKVLSERITQQLLP